MAKIYIFCLLLYVPKHLQQYDSVLAKNQRCYRNVYRKYSLHLKVKGGNSCNVHEHLVYIYFYNIISCTYIE